MSLQSYPNGLHLSVKLNGLFAHLAAKAAFLVAAEGGRGVEMPVAVDPYRAGLDRVRQTVGFADILGPDACRQPVAGEVGATHQLIPVIEGCDGCHRAKDLFLDEG